MNSAHPSTPRMRLGWYFVGVAIGMVLGAALMVEGALLSGWWHLG